MSGRLPDPSRPPGREVRANPAQLALIRVLPPEPAAKAVDLTERAGSSEFCFPLSDAPVVLDALLLAGLLPLGGDLWWFEDGEYFAAGENWWLNPIEGELAADRVGRIAMTARTFFEVHHNAENGWVTFVV